MEALIVRVVRVRVMSQRSKLECSGKVESVATATNEVIELSSQRMERVRARTKQRSYRLQPLLLRLMLMNPRLNPELTSLILMPLIAKHLTHRLHPATTRLRPGRLRMEPVPARMEPMHPGLANLFHSLPRLDLKTPAAQR